MAGGSYATFGVSSATRTAYDQRHSFNDATFYGIDTMQQWYSAGVNQGGTGLALAAGQQVDVQLALYVRPLPLPMCPL
jgi:hypothetical protein